MDCIFCKIVEGELPSYKIYEDKRILAFLDINPVNKGHVLVIPKEHYLNVTDTPVDLLKELVAKCQQIAKAATEAVGVRDYNLTSNNGRGAGQMVDHVHFHIIPRFEKDNLHPWPGKTLTNEEMQRVAENIKKLI